MTLAWTDTEDLALALDEAHPDVDPAAIRFDRLRNLVEGLEEFEPPDDQHVNEQILEALQAAWIEERQDRLDQSDDGPSYKPHTPYR